VLKQAHVPHILAWHLQIDKFYFIPFFLNKNVNFTLSDLYQFVADPCGLVLRDNLKRRPLKIHTVSLFLYKEIEIEL
jgi:hypothetical protein